MFPFKKVLPVYSIALAATKFASVEVVIIVGKLILLKTIFGKNAANATLSVVGGTY